MSRRYGRNQKRRAREEIARLEQERARLNEAYRRDVPFLERALAEKRDALAAVADALGPAFVGLPLNELMLRIFDTADMEHAPDSFPIMPPGGDARLTMQVLNIQSSEDRVQDMVHVRVRLAGVQSAYALSNASIRRLPGRVLAKNIAEELAAHLVRELVQRGVRP